MNTKITPLLILLFCGSILPIHALFFSNTKKLVEKYNKELEYVKCNLDKVPSRIKLSDDGNSYTVLPPFTDLQKYKRLTLKLKNKLIFNGSSAGILLAISAILASVLNKKRGKEPISLASFGTTIPCACIFYFIHKRITGELEEVDEKGSIVDLTSTTVLGSCIMATFLTMYTAMVITNN